LTKTKPTVITVALLALICSAVIAMVICRMPDRSTPTGISAVAGGITWLELYAVAGGGLAICLAIAACVALLMSKRNGS